VSQLCDISHKFPGSVDNSRKPVDNPAHMGAAAPFVKRTRRRLPAYLLSQRYGKSSWPSLSISILELCNMYTAKIIGEHKKNINMIPIKDPIMSVIFYSQKIECLLYRRHTIHKIHMRTLHC
jgi:hypothetical protein